MRTLLLTLALLSCGGDTDTDGSTSSGATDPQWYLGCGDPACQGYTGPFDGVPLCSDEGVSLGDDCTEEGTTCDPEDSCNALIQCSTSDPLDTPYGCPVSQAKHKRAVRYLDDADKAKAAEELTSMKLATWRYTGALDDGKPHVGFVIEDAPGSAAVSANGTHVDLYSYTSLAVATIQQQQKQIEALEARLTTLESRCD